MEVKSLMNRNQSLPPNKGGKGDAGPVPFSFKVGFGTPVGERTPQREQVFALRAAHARASDK